MLEESVGAILVIKSDAINLSADAAICTLFVKRGFLHHESEVGSTCLRLGAIRELRLTDLDSGLERGLIYPAKKISNAGAHIYTCIAIGLG